MSSVLVDKTPTFDRPPRPRLRRWWQFWVPELPPYRYEQERRTLPHSLLELELEVSAVDKPDAEAWIAKVYIGETEWWETPPIRFALVENGCWTYPPKVAMHTPCPHCGR